MVDVAGHDGELCGASMSSSKVVVGTEVELEILVRFVREIEKPGMFIEPMKGPFKIRTGRISCFSGRQRGFVWTITGNTSHTHQAD